MKYSSKYGRVSAMAALLAAYSAVASAKDDKAEDASKLSNATFLFEHVSCKGAPNEIRIVVDRVKKSVGLITADLFPNREEGFLKGRGRIKQVKFAARSPQTKFCIKAPENGDFAISVYHDRNANGDFDKTGLGLPAEPWGLSMNPKVRFGPPSVEKTIFPVAETGATVKIKLNN